MVTPCHIPALDCRVVLLQAKLLQGCIAESTACRFNTERSRTKDLLLDLRPSGIKQSEIVLKARCSSLSPSHDVGSASCLSNEPFCSRCASSGARCTQSPNVHDMTLCEEWPGALSTLFAVPARFPDKSWWSMLWFNPYISLRCTRIALADPRNERRRIAPDPSLLKETGPTCRSGQRWHLQLSAYIGHEARAIPHFWYRKLEPVERTNCEAKTFQARPCRCPDAPELATFIYWSQAEDWVLSCTMAQRRFCFALSTRGQEGTELLANLHERETRPSSL